LTCSNKPSNFVDDIPRSGIRMRGYYYAYSCVNFQMCAWGKASQHLDVITDVYCDKEKFVSVTGGVVHASRIPLIELVCDLSDGGPSKCRCVLLTFLRCQFIFLIYQRVRYKLDFF